IPTYQPPGLPSRSGFTTTDTLSPGLIEVRFQPSCTRLFGPFISIAQVSTLPLASVTSTLNEECGLDQLNSVTTPVIFTTRVRSNIAPEWCTHAGGEAPSSTAPSSSARTGTLRARPESRDARAFTIVLLGMRVRWSAR